MGARSFLATFRILGIAPIVCAASERRWYENMHAIIAIIAIIVDAFREQ